jgi:ABC-type branched-subunit amino acid transport system ATPase component
MENLLSGLDALRRPRLLIQAARIGSVAYRRDPALRRLLGTGHVPQTGAALAHLMDMEAELNDQRRSGDLAYSASRHVEILIAMMGEARLLRAAHG